MLLQPRKCKKIHTDKYNFQSAYDKDCTIYDLFEDITLEKVSTDPPLSPGTSASHFFSSAGVKKGELGNESIRNASLELGGGKFDEIFP